MAKPTIAILIPAHNEEKMIASCVWSCLTQTRPANQIIVVNDGSTDGTRDILARYGDRITVVTTEVATGNKSKAQEIGIKHITTDIFIATDGDTVLDEHFLEHIEREFIEHPEVGAVAGYVQSMKGNYLTAAREIDYVFGQDLYKYAQACIGYVFVIAGCAGAFKTSLFRDGTIHFDHDTLTEDLDFTYTLHEAGIPIRFNMNAVAYTQDPHTLSSYVNQMRRWYAGGWQAFLKHWRIMLREPNAALLLSLNYIEGLVFSFLFFVTLFINTYIFFKLFLLYFVIGTVIGAYAAIRRKRIDLLLYSPVGTFLRALHAYLFLEQFFIEVVLDRKNMIWFHPERRVKTT
jgi:cellulose synthase/poly-beta-1,6-N-acetylglucosamine synthase-like glycosyltransferase